MGNDATALVFYGYCWNEEDTEFDTDLNEVVKAILTRRGHPDPWDVHYAGPNPYGAYRAWAATPEGAAEVAQNRELTAAVKAEIGVDWGRHCAGDNPMPYLLIPTTETRCDWGEPKPLDPAKFTVNPDWKVRLDAFLASQEIEPPEGGNQPGWWTAAYWG